MPLNSKATFRWEHRGGGRSVLYVIREDDDPYRNLALANYFGAGGHLGGFGLGLGAIPSRCPYCGCYPGGYWAGPPPGSLFGNGFFGGAGL